MIRGNPLNQLNLELESEAASQGKSPMRRCVVTGQRLPREELLRFVASPEGVITFDVKANLPGRGVWVSPNHQHLEKAIKQNLLSRGAKQQVTVPEDFPEKVGNALKNRMLSLIQRAYQSRELVNGYEKCASMLQAGDAKLLIHADDASEDGKKKLNKQVLEDIVIIGGASRDELSQLLNIPNPVHLAVKSAGLAKVIRQSHALWAGFMKKDAL